MNRLNTKESKCVSLQFYLLPAYRISWQLNQISVPIFIYFPPSLCIELAAVSEEFVKKALSSAEFNGGGLYWMSFEGSAREGPSIRGSMLQQSSARVGPSIKSPIWQQSSARVGPSIRSLVRHQGTLEWHFALGARRTTGHSRVAPSDNRAWLGWVRS